jgi:hypothetical protein
MKWLAAQNLAACCNHSVIHDADSACSGLHVRNQSNCMRLRSGFLGLGCSVRCCLPPCLLLHFGHSFCPSSNLFDEIVCPQREVLAKAHLRFCELHITTGMQCTIETEKSRCPVLQNQVMLLQPAAASSAHRSLQRRPEHLVPDLVCVEPAGRRHRVVI